MFKTHRFLLIIALFFFSLVVSCGGGGGGGESSPAIEQTASKILETQNSGQQYYTTLASQGDPSAIQKTVDYLKTQPNVTDASVGEDGVSIWVKYDSGVEGIILTKSFESLGGTISSQSKTQNVRVLQLNESPLLTSTANNKKAIILLPVDSEPGYKDESADDIFTYLQNSGYSVEIYRDEAVTVDLMKTLSNYNFIYMTTHGGVGFAGVGRNVQIMTGQVANSSTMRTFWNYLKAGTTSGLTIFSPPKTNKTYFGLNKNFFDDYTYPGTFVYMNACSSLKNDSLADAFLNNGASVYIGWDNISFSALGNLHNPEFFQELSKPNNTLIQAYNATIAKYYPATIYKDSNKNGQYHALLLNGQNIGDVNDTTIDYSLSLKYKGNPEYVLNVQQATGQISGSVKDAITQSPLQGVSVNVYSGSSIISTGTTDANGTYSLSVPAGSGYRVEFTKAGYIPATYYNISVEANTTIYLETVLQIDTTHSGTGNISGKIVNALDGTGVNGLTINLRAGINVMTGPIVATTTTQGGGFYSFTGLNAGSYTAEASGDGYNTTYFTVICIGGTTTANQDATITPILSSGETRIILTWGEIPWDLDSHLTGPLPDGTRFHMYYWYAESCPDWGGCQGSPWPEYVKLDLDDIYSYGPETTTIYQQISGIYRFSVHDYTNRNSSSSYALSNSGAQVRVYRGSNLVAIFNVPSNQEGTLWTVFEMSGDTITPINTMSYESIPWNIQSLSRGKLVETDAPLIRNLPLKKHFR